MTAPILHLASASPRRREILAALGIPITHGGADIDESRQEGEAVESMARRLAREKALAASSSLPILAADTLVVLGDEVFGKPASGEHAHDMLSALSGRDHRVLTGVAVRHGEELWAAMSDTTVRFRDIRPDEIEAYWQSGEPAGKAGAYAIQGLGGVFVEAVEGSYSGVVGLPVFETAALLQKVGIDVIGGMDGQ
jgi:septum formation protein